LYTLHCAFHLLIVFLFLFLLPLPPISTLFPYTTLFRSVEFQICFFCMIGYIFCHLLGLLHAAKFVGQCFVISTSIIERGIWIQLITFIFYFDLLTGREVA